MSTIRLQLAVLLSVTLFCFGCANASSPSAGDGATPPSSQPSASDVPTASSLPSDLKSSQADQPVPQVSASVSSQVIYGDEGIDTVPAESGVSTDVALEAAEQSVAHSDYALLAPGEPAAQLDWVRFNVLPDVAPTKPKLAWVLTYQGSPHFKAGPPAAAGASSSAAPSPSPSVNCVFTTIVDANTGDTLSSFQHCVHS